MAVIKKYAVRLLARIWQVLFTVFLAVTISFFALALVPGDPIDIRLGPLAKLSQEQREILRQELGLHNPLWQQYLDHMQALATGNLGYSYNQHLEVTTIIARQAHHTVQLATAAILLAVLLAFLGQIFLRYRSSWEKDSKIRQRIFDACSAILTATPNYWLGFVLLMIFANLFQILPSGGESLAALILPALTLALPVAAVIGQVVNAELAATENTAFALSSRARGMSRAGFALRHGVKHAAVAVSAVTVNIIGALLGGAILTETVFARSGLGRVTLEAVIARDMPVVLGLVAVGALIFALLGQLLEIFVTQIDTSAAGAK